MSAAACMVPEAAKAKTTRPGGTAPGPGRPGRVPARAAARRREARATPARTQPATTVTPTTTTATGVRDQKRLSKSAIIDGTCPAAGLVLKENVSGTKP